MRNLSFFIKTDHQKEFLACNTRLGLTTRQSVKPFLTERINLIIQNPNPCLSTIKPWHNFLWINIILIGNLHTLLDKTMPDYFFVELNFRHPRIFSSLMSEEKFCPTLKCFFPKDIYMKCMKTCKSIKKHWNYTFLPIKYVFKKTFKL